MVATCSRITRHRSVMGRVASEAKPRRAATSKTRSPGTSEVDPRMRPSRNDTDREPPVARTVRVPVMRAWATKPTKSASGKAARSPASVAPGAGVGPPAAGTRTAMKRSGAEGSN
jgi:hypothetical protein